MFLAAFLDFVDPLDGLDGLRPQFAIVFDRRVSSLLEFEARIDCELLAGEFAVHFGPFCLTWVLLSVECFSALLSAESKLLKRNFMKFIEMQRKL